MEFFALLVILLLQFYDACCVVALVETVVNLVESLAVFGNTLEVASLFQIHDKHAVRLYAHIRRERVG